MQKILFIIFGMCIISLGIYLVSFSERNARLIKVNTTAISINDSLHRVALKNDSIILRNDSNIILLLDGLKLKIK
jgi:sulfite exporter TauE/SafE